MGGQTLLNYELTTEPFPLRASTTTGSPNGKFTIVASNPNPEEPVTIKKVSISIPIGTGAAELSITQPPKPIPPVDWSLSQTKLSDHVVEYDFKPDTGKGQVGEQGLAFIFNAIQVNMQPGTVNVTVVEEVSDGDATSSLKITKFPAGWGQVEFWANPEIISAGDSTVLNWHGPAKATYTIDYYIPQQGIVHVPAEGEKPLADQGQYRPLGGLERNTIFYLTVKALVANQEYVARQTVTVTVQSVKITASGPDDPVNALDKVEIKWTTNSAKTVTLEPGKQTADATSGSGKFIVQPTSNTTYTLIAKDAKGREKRALVAVYVNPPQITTFTALPVTAKPGSLVKLTWETVSSAFTSLTPSVGKVKGKGSAEVMVQAGTTSYLLMAQSQPPLAIETVNVIGVPQGFTLVESDMKYAGVNAALVVGDKLFLIDSVNKRIWFSTDGSILSPVEVVKPWKPIVDNCSVVFDAGNGPRMWILGGRDNDGPKNSVWRSTDALGSSWEQVQPVNNKIWSPRSLFGCVVFKKKIWVFGGLGDSIQNLKNDVWSSPDGANWTLETESPGWSARGWFAATTFTVGATNQIWLCGGHPGLKYTNDVYYTDDGVHWSQFPTQNVPWTARSSHLFRQIGDSLWLMGGIGGGIDSDLTKFRDVWTIGGAPQNNHWTRYPQDAPWAIDNNGGFPYSSVVFNGLMWCAGSHISLTPNPGIWYFLP